MTLTPETLAEIRRLREAAPRSGDVFEDCGVLTDSEAFYRAAHKHLPELLDEIERLNAFEWLYENLVEACQANCDGRTLDNLATVTQDRALLRDE